MSNTVRRTPVEEYRASRWPWWFVAILAVVYVIGTFGFWRYLAEAPEDFFEDAEHFKYGSIGADSYAGIPYWIWRVLPEVFAKHLPEPGRFTAGQRTDGLAGYGQFGFILEDGMDRPIGFSKRRMIVDRIGLNCAVCHTGTVRVPEGMDAKAIYPGSEMHAHSAGDDRRIIILGMPANTVNLEDYFQFLFDCASDARFTKKDILPFIERRTNLDPIERILLRGAVAVLRESLLERQEQLAYWRDLESETGHRFGPGRVDTFTPYKTIYLGFPYDGTIGTADFPSIWNQRPRRGLELHWDGNNTSVFERNISAALGAGATPVSVDIARLLRVAEWCGSPRVPIDGPHPGASEPDLAALKAPYPGKGELPIPRYPFGSADGVAAAKKSKESSVFDNRCADCHGWKGDWLGKVVNIDKVGTDRHRLDSYTEDLAANQGTFGSGKWWRFRMFRKTRGYTSMPLDGAWARAPYLHNGSVPTMADLLNPPLSADEFQRSGFVDRAARAGLSESDLEARVRAHVEKARAMGRRPAMFYRGDDRYDTTRLGFRVDRARSADGRRLFLFDTTIPGNGNAGHPYGAVEHAVYGAPLSADEVRELLEYFKTIDITEGN